MKQPLADMTEDIKAMIPRHLRKPWKILHKANYGNREEHMNAVRELSTITQNLSDGEVYEMAQCTKIHTTVGLSRIKDCDLRLFLPPPPCPKSVKESSIPIQFWNILSKLPDEDVHQCIKYFTTTALHGKIHCDLDRYCLLLLAEFVYFTEAHNTLQKHELPQGNLFIEVECCW